MTEIENMVKRVGGHLSQATSHCVGPTLWVNKYVSGFVTGFETKGSSSRDSLHVQGCCCHGLLTSRCPHWEDGKVTVKRPPRHMRHGNGVGVCDGRSLPWSVTSGHPPAGVPPCLTRMRACHTVRACGCAGQVVAYDFGIKHNILRRLASYGCKITVVPSTTAPEEVMALNPDGVLFRWEGEGWRGGREGRRDGRRDGGRD